MDIIGRFRFARLGFLLVALSAIAWGGTYAAIPANAAVGGVTYCADDHRAYGPVTGTLIVPPNSNCYLDGRLTGDAIVQAGSVFYDQGAEITGNVHIDGGSADFDNSRVGGYVVLDHGRGFVSRYASIGGAVVGSLGLHGAIFLQGSTVGGRMAITGTDSGNTVVATDGLTVGGEVVLTSVRVALQDSLSVGGRLALRHVFDFDPGTPQYAPPFTPSVVCSGVIQGNVSIEDSAEPVDIGAGSTCRDQNAALTIQGTFLAFNNTGLIHLGGHITGAAVCRGNTRHPRGDSFLTGSTALEIDGSRIGQCARLPQP